MDSVASGRLLDESQPSRDVTAVSDAEKTTFWTAFIVSVKSNIGSACMGMPYTFSLGGLLGSLLGLLFCGVVSVRCMELLVRVKERLRACGKDVRTFGDVAHVVSGPRGRAIADFFIVVSQVGFCVSYIIFVGHNMNDVVRHWSGSEVGKIPFMLMCFPALIPLVMLPSIKRLGTVSLIAEITMALGIGIVLVYDARQISNHGTADMDNFQLATYPTFFGAVVYAFEGIGCTMPIQESMRNRALYPRVLWSSMTLVGSVLIVFGGCGYFAYGNDVNQIITLSLPDNMVTSLMQLAVALGLLFTYPLMMFPAYQVMETTLFNPLSPTFALKRRVMKVVVVLITVGVAVGIPSFNTLMSIIGAFACSALAFILPAYYHISVMDRELGKWERAFDWFCMAFGVLGGALSLGVTIAHMAEDGTGS